MKKTLLLNIALWCVVFAPSGGILAGGIGDRPDADGGQLRAILEGHRDWVVAVAFSPDGSTLVSGSDDHEIRLWDASNSEPKATLKGHRGSVRSVAFAPDGET